MIILYGNNLSVAVSSVAEQIVNNLKTSNNISTTQSAVSFSALSISAQAVGKPSWPYLSGVADIEIPIFKEVSLVNYPYQNYDAVKVEEDPDLSAFPAPNNIELSSVMDNSKYSVNGISTNECLLYAMTNGIFNYISSAVSASVHIETFNTNVIFESSSTSAVAVFNIPVEKSIDPVNLIGIMWSLSTSNIWKNANFIFDQSNHQLTAVMQNDINYTPPTHLAFSNFDGGASVTVNALGVNTPVLLPKILTTVYHVYSNDSISVDVKFKIFMIKLL